MSTTLRKFILPALGLCGLAINLMLLVRHMTGGGIAGCGGGSGCEALLNSRWSQVLGVPVAGIGGLVYLVLLISFRMNVRWPRDVCIGVLVGAAAWFVFIQAVVLGRFCPWCMTAHGIGVLMVLLVLRQHAVAGTLIAAVRVIGPSAAAAVFGMSSLQVLGPLPVTHRIDEVNRAGKASASSIHARGSGRKVEFDGGRKVYDVTALPHLGRTDAKCVMVEYFDYSCLACQTMRGFLDALIAKHPADICVVVLPVPMEHSCNHSLDAMETEHPDSCEIARHALALWRTKPDAFAAFHHALMDGMILTEARGHVLKLIPSEDLNAALRDPWIDELIQADIHDWVSFSTSTAKLPKLLITGKRILHGLPSGEADFIRVMERELGL